MAKDPPEWMIVRSIVKLGTAVVAYYCISLIGTALTSGWPTGDSRPNEIAQVVGIIAAIIIYVFGALQGMKQYENAKETGQVKGWGLYDYGAEGGDRFPYRKWLGSSFIMLFIISVLVWWWWLILISVILLALFLVAMKRKTKAVQQPKQ